MSSSSDEFRQCYRCALEAHIRSNAEVDALGLVMAALDEGRGLEDLLSIHQSLLPSLIDGLVSSTEINAVVTKAEEFLTVVAAPFEMTRLNWLKEALERQVIEQTQAVRDSERRFQDIAEVSGDWMWQTDREHRFTWIFGERIDALQIYPESLIGRTRWEVAGANPVTDDPWVQHKAELDAHQPFRHFRYEIAARTDAPMSMSTSGKPVFDQDGTFVGYRGTATDETVIVAVQRRAEAAEALLRRVFETSQDLILVTDRKGTLVRVSPSAVTLLGYDPDEMIGRSGAEFLYSEDLDNTRNEMRLARRAGGTQSFECRYVHKQGRIVTLWWKGVWSPAAQQHFFHWA